MKKLIAVALAAGIFIPFLAHFREFYYLATLIIAGGLFLSIKKKPLTLIDLLILFLLTIPLHTFRFGSKEHFIRLSEIAFAPLFLFWIVTKFLNREKEHTVIRKEFLLLGVYLFINILSTKNSSFPVISIEKILILAYLFLFTYMVSAIVNKKEKINTIIKAMIWISSISSVIAAIQCVFPSFLIFHPVPLGTAFGIKFYRAGAGWHDPNYYALYLAMNACLTLSYLLAGYEKKYKFLKICFALQIIGMLVTFSRTAMISFILVSLYLLSCYGRKKMALTMLLSIIITFSIIASSAAVIYKKYPFIASTVYRVAKQEQLVKQPTLIAGHRYVAFKANWAMFLDHPILGVGPFMAMYDFNKYKPLSYNYPYDQLASHNQYLQLLAEKGIFGFIIFLGFIFLMIKNINKFIKNMPPGDEYRTCLIGLKSAVFVYLISSLALETSYELQFWLTMGLSMAIFNTIKKEYLNV